MRFPRHHSILVSLVIVVIQYHVTLIHGEDMYWYVLHPIPLEISNCGGFLWEERKGNRYAHEPPLLVACEIVMIFWISRNPPRRRTFVEPIEPYPFSIIQIKTPT